MLQFSKRVYVEQVVFSHKIYFKHSKLNQYSLDQQILIVKKDPVKPVFRGSIEMRMKAQMESGRQLLFFVELCKVHSSWNVL